MLKQTNADRPIFGLIYQFKDWNFIGTGEYIQFWGYK